eukprot:CAMPEP_0194348900 /NCGR_PEP_ID=MMETSP0171-20130528/106789_1 /TAXON_ID=218684 /ORGANISM="Corethron pennatum, Strain L29A3" /LENGTH=162 /DNA_ID=CAMNT_0039116291 /DNA_START=68 /DNA_END=553 /DNA_ORIENTATION=+
MKYFPLLGVMILSTCSILFNGKEKCADEVNISAVVLKPSVDEVNVSSEVNVSAVVLEPWPLPVTYGLANVAGSGGSIINRILALKYERVCGKANSYNAYQQNEIHRQRDMTGYLDGWGFSFQKYNTALRKPPASEKINKRHLSNIEFDNCDYVAVEVPSKLW